MPGKEEGVILNELVVGSLENFGNMKEVGQDLLLSIMKFKLSDARKLANVDPNASKVQKAIILDKLAEVNTKIEELDKVNGRKGRIKQDNQKDFGYIIKSLKTLSDLGVNLQALTAQEIGQVKAGLRHLQQGNQGGGVRPVPPPPPAAAAVVPPPAAAVVPPPAAAVVPPPAAAVVPPPAAAVVPPPAAAVVPPPAAAAVPPPAAAAVPPGRGGAAVQPQAHGVHFIRPVNKVVKYEPIMSRDAANAAHMHFGDTFDVGYLQKHQLVAPGNKPFGETPAEVAAALLPINTKTLVQPHMVKARGDEREDLTVYERTQIAKEVFEDAPGALAFAAGAPEVDGSVTSTLSVNGNNIYSLRVDVSPTDHNYITKISFILDKEFNDLAEDYFSRADARAYAVSVGDKLNKAQGYDELNLIVPVTGNTEIDKKANLVIDAFAAANIGLNPCFQDQAAKDLFTTYLGELKALNQASQAPGGAALQPHERDLLMKATAVNDFKNAVHGDLIWEPVLADKTVKRESINRAADITIKYHKDRVAHLKLVVPDAATNKDITAYDQRYVKMMANQAARFPAGGAAASFTAKEQPAYDPTALAAAAALVPGRTPGQGRGRKW